MGRELYESEPAFRHAFDASCAEFDATLGISLKAVVFAGEDMAGVLNRTEYAQPAMFAVEYALAALWTSWGIEPTAVLGHSFGEYAAACAAGVLSLHDAATMVVARGRLVGALPANGQMIVVEAAADELCAAIQGAEDRVALAASNGPANNVISGERDTVTAIARKFVSMGRRVKSLQVSHAFHSPLIDPVLDTFESVAAAVNFSPPTVTFVSTVTGDVANGRVLHQPPVLAHTPA